MQEEASAPSSKYFEQYLKKCATDTKGDSKDLPTAASKSTPLEPSAPSTSGTSPSAQDVVINYPSDMNYSVSSEGSTTSLNTTIEIERFHIEKCEPNDIIEGPITDDIVDIIPKAIKHRDLGLLQFDEKTGKAIISESLKIEIIKKGSKYFQNKDGPFLPTKNRCMSENWFHKKLGQNGGEVVRSWLVYSPTKRSAFCVCCLIFSKQDQRKNQSSLELENGFSNWKKPEKLSAHENGYNHRICFTQWKEMERNLATNTGLIDIHVQSQIESEKEKWREILKRILHCIKYLATQNLALRGHRESLNENDDSESKNVGNFLGLIKLLATFDPIMKNHLSNIEKNPGSTSYTSPTIQNEFIHLMAMAVRESILTHIYKSKYYGLMFDSTPDQDHRDQMAVVRYVDIDFEKKTVRINESFLGYLKISQKDAGSLVEEILKQLDKDKMNIQDCRSQCYDNAAVMAGHRTGVHQRILEKNELAIFVNCDNHSLNLVGVHAAKQDVAMITFFGTIEALYVFFSHSTLRWEKLKESVPIVVKSESETRWSARVEAVKPINRYLDDILNLLQDMSIDRNQTNDTRSEANSLYNRMLTYDFLTLLGFWHNVLSSIDRVQKRLQDPTMNFHDAALDIKSLRNHFSTERETLVNEAIVTGSKLCQDWEVVTERRTRRKKRMPGEQATDAGLSAKEEIERVMKGTIDRLIIEMDTRFTRLNDINEKFGFLLNVKNICYGYNDLAFLKNKCLEFGTVYGRDIDGHQLIEEIVDARMLLSTRKHLNITKPQELLEFIVQYGDEGVFPNLRISLQILLTIAVSIASCERSFSKLKLILSYLRTTMGQQRLVDLALLSIEREETEHMNFEEIINQFAAQKARRVHL